jgi:hypothetical protein
VNMKVGDLIATQIVQIVCIRFSAFDRMFTVFGTELGRFSERTPMAIKYLQEHGFKYVSEADLMTPYEGIEGHGSEGYTWFGRFFDYV